EGPPIAGFLPAVVTEEEFLLARAGQDGRVSGKGGRPVGTRQCKYVNVFRGMLTHARDGEGFVLNNKGTTSAPELILVNARGHGGRGKCDTFPYPFFEESILSCLREVDPCDVLPRREEAPSRPDVLRAKLADVRQDIARIQADLKAGYSKALVEV